MNNELIRYTSSSAPMSRRNRKVTQQSKQVYDEVRMAALKNDGSMALAAHIMEGFVQLDARRMELAQGEPALSALLTDIEMTALRQAKLIQSKLYNDWGL